MCHGIIISATIYKFPSWHSFLKSSLNSLLKFQWNHAEIFVQFWCDFFAHSGCVAQNSKSDFCPFSCGATRTLIPYITQKTFRDVAFWDFEKSNFRTPIIRHNVLIHTANNEDGLVVFCLLTCNQINLDLARLMWSHLGFLLLSPDIVQLPQRFTL